MTPHLLIEVSPTLSLFFFSLDRTLRRHEHLLKFGHDFCSCRTLSTIPKRFDRAAGWSAGEDDDIRDADMQEAPGGPEAPVNDAVCGAVSISLELFFGD